MGAPPRTADFIPRGELKSRVHQRLVESLDLTAAQRLPVQELRDECLRRVDSLLSEQHTPLTTSEKQQLLREVMDEIFGLGPLEELMRDPTITDILVNGPHQVYAEKAGRLTLTDSKFRDDRHLLLVIQRIAAGVGRRVDESSPMLDARLQDGSRVNAIIPPLALHGPAMSVRRFAGQKIDAARLVEIGAWTPEMSRFMEAAVRCRANILVAGGTGTGKTTLLNVLSKWIPEGERVITIEDAAELNLQREHVVVLETRPPNIEGKGEVTQRELLKNTLRMRPDRIIIGECRGAESLDMLQAMNTGHEGSMTTVHANTPRDALRRIENMVAMSGMNWPVHVIRDQMANTLDLVIHLQRLTGGRRKVTSIVEVCGMEREVILVQEIFKYKQERIDKDGNAEGTFEACGVRPRLLDRMIREGLDVPPSIFAKRGVS